MVIDEHGEEVLEHDRYYEEGEFNVSEIDDSDLEDEGIEHSTCSHCLVKCQLGSSI